MLEVSGIVKTFGGMRVLDGASLTVGDGEAAGLVGASGCGKSTLARVIAGLVTPEAGEAVLDGKTLFAPGVKYDRKAGVGVQLVFQQPHAALDPALRVGDGVKELIRFHKLASRKEVAALAMKMCGTVELESDVLGHFPHQISGGEAQRIAVGKALLLSPRVLILDEATSMLDVSTQANILAVIKRETAAKGASVLMISHDAELVGAYCGRVYEMREGILSERNEK